MKTYAWPAGAQVMGADGQPDFPSALSTEKQSLKILQTPPDEMVEQDYQDPDSGEKATLHLHAAGPSDLALLQITGTGFQPLAFARPGRPSSGRRPQAGLVQLSFRHEPSANHSAPSQCSGGTSQGGNSEDGAPRRTRVNPARRCSTRTGRWWRSPSPRTMRPIQAARKLIP